MNYELLVGIQIRMLKLSCELEGMKAENKQREFAGRAMAYVEDSFVILGRKFDLLLDVLKQKVFIAGE